MQSPVLIVIDMIGDQLQKWEPRVTQKLIRGINDLVSILRRHQLPILWVRQEFEPDLRDAFLEMRDRRIHSMIKGTTGCQLLPELAVAASDTVLVKKRYSAFYGTDLDQILGQLAPDALILAGVNTHACIRTTAIDAYQRDWQVILAGDCVDSCDREHHEVSMKYMNGKIAKVLTNREIAAVLEAARAKDHPVPNNCG